MAVTVLMCKQMLLAHKMGYRMIGGLGYDYMAREFMKKKTPMNKKSFEPMFEAAHARIMQQIKNDDRWFEFNYRMGGGATYAQQCLFGV